MSLDMLKDGAMAVIGGLISSIIGLAYWQRLHKKVDDGAKELKRLRDDNFVKLQDKVDGHINDDKSQMILTVLENLNESFDKLEVELKEHAREDKSQQVLTEVKNLRGQVTRLGDSVERQGEDTAKHGAEIKANAKYIENIDKSLQKHKGEKHK